MALDNDEIVATPPFTSSDLPKDMNVEVGANLPSTSSEVPQNMKRPLGSDKPCPRSKKHKSISIDVNSQEKETATNQEHVEHKKVGHEDIDAGIHDMDERHSQDNDRGLKDNVTTDDIDTSEPSDAEKGNEGGSASTGETSAENVYKLAKSNPITNEEREMAEKTGQGEVVKGPHGKKVGEKEVTDTPLQNPAEERENFPTNAPVDVDKTSKTISDDREISLMEHDSEKLVSEVAESNPPVQISHVANEEEGEDAKSLHEGKKIAILKPIQASEKAKLKFKPLQEIQRIFRNKAAGKDVSKVRQKCKGCYFDKKSLRHHLGHKTACKKLYSQEEIDTLEREAKYEGQIR